MARPTPQELQKFYVQLDLMPEMSGVGVGYVGDGSCEVLRDSNHNSGLQTFVVLKETDIDASQVTRDADQPNLYVELASLGLNCAAAVIGWAAIIASDGVLLSLGGAATVGATLQCGNAIVRTAHYGSKVDDTEWIAWADSHDWYVDAGYLLDVLSLGAAVQAGAKTVRTVLALQRATGRELPDILKGLSRAERKRLSQELLRMQKPGLSNAAMKGLIRAGSFPKRFATTQVTELLFAQLRDAISATLAFGSSGLNGVLRLVYVDVFQE
jgi:hypothetical protein